MIQKIENANIIVIGGGNICKELLVCLSSNIFACRRPKVLGIIAFSHSGVGVTFAKSKDIFTCDSHKHIKNKNKANLVILTKHDYNSSQLVFLKNLTNIKVVKYKETLILIDFMKVEEEERKVIENIKQLKKDTKEETILKYFKQYSKKIKDFIFRKNNHFYSVKFEIEEHEKALFHIIQGSTIPTFVINRDHVIVKRWQKSRFIQYY